MAEECVKLKLKHCKILENVEINYGYISALWGFDESRREKAGQSALGVIVKMS